jgi:hypothetical protein
MRRIKLISPLALALGTTMTLPAVVHADQVILVRDAVLEMAPGDVTYYIDDLAISAAGLPTVVFDGSTGFADDETVVATIALSTHDIDGLGSVELVSSPTITGTTPADWTTGAVPSEFVFVPRIELWYTAPSSEELGCDDHPGERFTTSLGISGTLVGSMGTTASFSADDFPRYVVFAITCPVATPTLPPTSPAPEAPTITPPPTDAVPTSNAGSGDAWAGRLFSLALAAGGAFLVLTFLSRPSRRRP